MRKLRIPQATQEGYIEVEPMGCFNAAYMDSDTRRGRVIGGGANSTYAHRFIERYDSTF